MKIRSIAAIATAVLVNPNALAQDITEAKVLAYDRKANVLVLTDRSVFPLEKMESAVPEGLKAGDRVEIQYDSHEDDGIVAIHSIKLISP